MPAKIKLIYFPLTGRGEIVRYILKYGGIPYEEEIIPSEDWRSQHKSKAIMGHLPIIEVDGKALGETLAICRYLAKQTDLYPDNAWDQALADMYVDGANDLWLPSYPCVRAMHEKNMEKMNEEFAKFKAEHLQPFMDRYTGFLKANKSGWLVGNKVSWADLYVVEALARYDGFFPGFSILDGYPELKAYHDKVHQLPKIKEHLASRKYVPAPPKKD